jgi:protein-disulfide isomerase
MKKRGNKTGIKKYLPTILIVAAVLVVIGFVVFAMTRPDSSKTSQQPLTADDTAQLKVGGTQGNPNSKVVVTEFGDYQCPVCGNWHPYIKNTLLPKYKDSIFFVFKNFPLYPTPHPNALIAAQAVEAAALQGKFWEMHDKLYENQNQWSAQSANDATNTFNNYASQIGLNVDKFKNDFNSNQVKSLIQKDSDLAGKLGLQGTPTFLVNGQVVEIKSGFTDLQDAIDKALAQSQ